MGSRPERRAVDADGDAVVFEAVQECIYEGFSLEEIVPFWVIKICGDERGFSTVAFSHQFEEGVDLFGFEGEIAQFIDEEQVITAEIVDEPWGGAVGKGGVEIVDEILGMIKSSSVTGEKGLPQKAAGKPRFACTGGADEDDVFLSLQKGEAGQLLDLGLADSGLPIKGEGLEGPVPGDLGLLESVILTSLLAVDLLLDQETLDDLGHGGAILFRSLKLLIEGLGHALEA